MLGSASNTLTGVTMHTTFQYFAPSALLPTGWADNVLITINQEGWITDVQCNQQAQNAISLNGPVLPGMLNVHSHAFQRAMAGLTERATGEKDSFWTWREIMYQFLEKLNPEDQQAIASQLYVEMLKAGFTTVGEFHYVHHQADGTPYQDRALTSRHILAASKTAGISITLLPVLYAYSGFGGQIPTEGQKRFINDDQKILDIISSLIKDYHDDPQISLGLAHHSLRAVTPSMLAMATDGLKTIAPDAPVHIHIAEQIKEVNDCLAWSKQRPVEWLCNHVNIDKHWCLVHATHMTNEEIRALAVTKATVGICPTTEANLGDGLFNLPEYMNQCGSFGIGSDSHISVSMVEELRLLEYGQRLFHQERNITKIKGQASVGAALYQMALVGGAQALGRASGAIEIGKRADFIALDQNTPTLLYRDKDFILDAMIFSGNINPIRHVVVGGQQLVIDFKHRFEEPIYQNYKKTIKKLLD